MTNPTINIMRHESIFDPREHPYPIHIIGAGATGSHVFAALVGLGVTNISVYDYDVVEEHNLANQIYMGADVGLPKVEACSNYYCNKLGVDEPPDDMKFIEMKVTEATLSEHAYFSSGGIVFLLTDTMASRRTIFNSLTRLHVEGRAAPTRAMSRHAVTLFIETRMASTHGNIFTVNPFDKAARDAWLSTLVDDTDEDTVELSPCGTALSVGPTASIIANYAVWQLLQFYTDPLAVQPQVDLFLKPTLTMTSAIAA